MRKLTIGFNFAMMIYWFGIIGVLIAKHLTIYGSMACIFPCALMAGYSFTQLISAIEDKEN